MTYDFTNIPDDNIDEVLRLGEETLNGTVSLAIAQDQRATSLMGIFGAAAVALLGVSGALISSTSPNLPLIYSSFTIAVGFFLVSLVFGWSGRPSDFYVAGYEPKQIHKSTGDISITKKYVCEDIQIRIDSNRIHLANAAWSVKVGGILAILSILLGAGVFLVIR